MTINAKIMWDGLEGPVIFKFLYPLSEGSQFVMRDGETTYVCKVTLVMHFPCNFDSANEPSIAYHVDRTSTKSLSSWWHLVVTSVKDLLAQR